MIQIDMEMPKSCSECPFQGETYHGCPIVPGVVAWQAEISDKCKNRRSEHCPLQEVKDERQKKIEDLTNEIKKLETEQALKEQQTSVLSAYYSCRCVICGKVVPEGREVCPNCEKRWGTKKI